MADSDPLDLAAPDGVGKRVERVANQAEYLLDPDQLKHADQNVRNCLYHLSLLTGAITQAPCASKATGRRLANTLARVARSHIDGDQYSRVCGFGGKIAVNADTNLVLQGQHLNRLSGDLSMDFARFRPLFLAAIATLAGASAEAGQAPSGLGDLVPGVLPAVVNIYSMKIVPQPDAKPAGSPPQHHARRKSRLRLHHRFRRGDRDE